MWCTVEIHEPSFADKVSAFRNDPDWPGILQFLQEGVWHFTTPTAWEAIQRSGFIKPNRGDLPDSFSQSNTSYGRLINAVCLFDFLNATEEGTISAWRHTADILKSPAVLLRLRRSAIEGRLIPNEANCDRANNRLWQGRYGAIPFVEAWCLDDIPTEWIADKFIVKDRSDFWHGRFVKFE